LIKEEVSETGKDNTVENVISKGVGASPAEAAWAMQNAKSEDLPDLISSFGKNTGRNLDYAVKYGLIKPRVTESAARSGGLESSQQLRDYYKKQDKQNLQLAKVERFASVTPSTLTAQEQAEENEKMRARVMSLKGATVRRDSFKKLPDSVFENEKNVQALLMSGDTGMYGYARSSVNKKTYDIMVEATKNNFAAIAKANPDLAKAIALDPRDKEGYGNLIPQNIKASAEAIHRQNPNTSYEDALKDIVESMT
jgi:hypothetical protein